MAPAADDALMVTAIDPAAATPRERGSEVTGRGTLVGRYVVLAKLGAGGMGVVFAAYDPELDRKVALKLLHPQPAASAEPEAEPARARLVREAQALARLNHPHIVAVHDVGEHEGAVWLAMEYVDGETLAAWLRQRRRPWREVLEILVPAARGLAAAHRAGLVHRDIKPDNIMIGRDGRVRVMDLGLARALDRDEHARWAAADRPHVTDATAPAVAGPIASDAPTVAAVAARAVGASSAPAREVDVVASMTPAGAMLGTPAYMSPEQFRGEPVDARTDVFSFCVTMWEALIGERPFAGETLIELVANVIEGKVRPVPREPHARRVPGWLRRVCTRGLAAEPARRFASMTDLLDALSRGQALARAQAWLAGAAATTALGASILAYQQYDRSTRIAACEDAGATIVDVWNDGARARVREGLLATGLSSAPVTADKVMPFLDAHAEAWREQRARACLQGDLEGTFDADLLDRAVWCLDERRMDLAALVDELARADATVVRKAVLAAAGLSSVSTCTDEHVLTALPPPPTESRARFSAARTTLSQARTMLAVGNYKSGLALTRTSLADVEALDWPPLAAAVRQLEGRLLEKTGAYAESEAASLSAYMDAAKVRAWDTAANAALTLVLVVGAFEARPAEGKVWAGHAQIAIQFAGDPFGLLEARRLSNLAVVHLSAGEYAEAKALHGRALAIREKALGPEHPEVAASLNNLANVDRDTGDYAAAKVLYERALAIWVETLGPGHPDVAATLNNLGNVHRDIGAYAESRALFERALAIWEETLGPEHPNVALALNNLGILFDVTGAYAEARALHERALAIREKTLGPEHPDVAASLNNLGRLHQKEGGYAEARALYERALAIWERALGPEHPDVALSVNNLAEVLAATGAYAEARPLYERALAIREQALGPEHPDVAVSLADLASLELAQDQPDRARARLERAVTIFDAHEGAQEGEDMARFNLARVLVRTGGARVEAFLAEHAP